jgi:hypothetical protein
MDRIQEVLILNDFLLFLASRKLYINGLTYFKYLSLWITKASTGPSHHKQDYQRRVLRFFDQYYQEFSSLLPSQFPSFCFSIPPLFPKRNVYVEWPYMEIKQQQQKTPITKKSDLDLNVFLHSVTCLPIKDTNKHFIFNLGDTNDVMFSITNFLDFDPIKNYFYKSRVLSCANETILDITFKFMAGHNIQLMFDCFYAPRKKQQLFKYLDLMCRQGSPVTIQIELFIYRFTFFFYFFFFLKHFIFFFSFIFSFTFIILL